MSAEALALADLRRSGLSPEQASFAGIGAVTCARDLCTAYAAVPALVLPYADLKGRPLASPPFHRIRYLSDAPKRRTSLFRAPKVQRYAQPPGSPVYPYLPVQKRFLWADVAADATHPLLIVEGEKKALKASVEGFACVGLGGVFNFFREGALLPELEAFQWKGRSVYICFDSDAAHNPQIQAAEARLAQELSMKRQAVLHLVRLPDGKGGAKQGVDDFLVAEGPEQFEKLLLSAPRMRKIDAAVISLNEHVAWIEKEGCVYDLRSKEFIQKSNFTNGSTYSSLEILTPTAKGTGVKRLSVAEAWLKHPHAQRYDYVEFRPETDAAVLQTDAGGLALNMWTGWNPEPGDVEPFLDLTRYLFADLRDHEDLPLRLMIYKAQNPGLKVPLALVLVGPQGSGKSLWAECVRDAFSPYTAEIPPAALGSQFNGWTERTLIGVINEAVGEQLKQFAPSLRALISDKRVMMNEKFRAARQIDSYTQYIITANERGVGAYSADDRRMIVANCPKKREQSFYRRIVEWKESGGGRALLHYLLNTDLEGWIPPDHAPLTAEKYMAYMESLTPVQRLAEEMQTATYHVVELWIQQALSWARHAELGSNATQQRYAREIIDSLQTIQIRPWYTPEELALMFPAISAQLHGQRGGARAAGSISRELRTAGITYLQCKDDPRGFRWRGMLRQYLIVSEADEWTQPVSQQEFERLMNQFPMYGQIKRS